MTRIAFRYEPPRHSSVQSIAEATQGKTQLASEMTEEEKLAEVERLRAAGVDAWLEESP